MGLKSYDDAEDTQYFVLVQKVVQLLYSYKLQFLSTSFCPKGMQTFSQYLGLLPKWQC